MLVSGGGGREKINLMLQNNRQWMRQSWTKQCFCTYMNLDACIYENIPVKNIF